nr:hypothetical protein [Tanacetum cinerariifolium]
MLNAQFQKFIHSEVLKTSNYDHDAREARADFKQYTNMEAQSFKDLMIQNMDSIDRCIVEIEVKAAYASSRNTNNSGFISDNGKAYSLENDCSKIRNDQSLEKQSSTSGNKSSRSGNECSERSNSGDDTDIRPSYDIKPMVEVDSNTTPNSSDMCNNKCEDDQNVDDHEDERVVLANLIANLKLDIDKNKTIQKQLRKANATLTHELNECKSALDESNDIRDRCRSALHNQNIELERYKKYRNFQLEKEEIECKYKETLGLLAQQKHQSDEALKTQA